MVEFSGQPFVNLSQNYGGDTLNTGVYIKALTPETGRVSFITAMGQDPFSRALIRKWQERGIDTESVLLDRQHQTGFYYIENDPSGERSFYYWRSDSAAKYLVRHPGFETLIARLQTYDALYLSGISVAILPADDRRIMIDQLYGLKEAGVKIVFDNNYRPALWPDVHSAQEIYRQMYALADLALLTFDDEQALWGDKDLEVCAQRLADFKIAELILKDGDNGCYCLANGEHHHVPTQKVEQIVDTTAAGDSFNAGFLTAWLNHQPLISCASLGNKVAGAVIQQKGAIVPLANIDLAF
jgi:2-dehydro-3-deoxygluconokinase